MTATTDRQDKFLLRFQDSELRKRLKIRAINNGRSTNAELLYLIQRGIEAVDRGSQEARQ